MDQPHQAHVNTGPQTGNQTDATHPPDQGLLERTCFDAHRRCAVCGHGDGGEDGRGLGLRFSVCGDGGCVEARFQPAVRHQGYDGMLHGGVTAALLDGAMTNCLFARGIVAVTAEMTVRFRHPVAVGQPLVVRAHVARSQPPLHVVGAEIVQAGQIKAKASGKFVESPASTGSANVR